MIDDESIARFGRIAEAPADLVHLCRQRPDMQRLRDALRDQAASAVEDGEGEILAFLDDGGIARAQHVERELARDLQGRLINDFEVYVVQIGAPRHPNSSCLTGIGVHAFAHPTALPDMSFRAARNTPLASASR